MKILITGINGMVASHLADLLLEREHEVIGTKRWQEDSSNIEHIKDKITLVDLNLNDLSNCIKVIEKYKPDAVSHLAAESFVGDSFDHPIESVHVNGIGTLNLLEAIRIVKDRLKQEEEVTGYIRDSNFNPIIHCCSSSEVYGLVKQEDIPIKETQIFNPANPYACGKVLADVVARMYYTNYGLKTIVTRMFTHFSYRRKMLSAEVNFANQIANIEVGLQEPVLKHGNLNSIRTFADARDAVEAYYLILIQPKTFGIVYNIGGKTTKTIKEMLEYMLSLSKKEIKLEQDPNLLRPHDVTLQIPCIDKFKNDYPDWEPRISFEQSIQDLLNEKRKIYGKE